MDAESRVVSDVVAPAPPGSGSFEPVRERLVPTERGAVAYGRIPRFGAEPFARRVEVRRGEPRVDDVLREAVAMGARRAVEPRGAVEVVPQRGDRGKTGQSLRSEGENDDLAADLELLAKRVSRRIGLTREQCGERDVAQEEHPQVAVVERASQRDRSRDEAARVLIVAVGERRVRGRGEHGRELVDVSGALQQLGG